MNSFSPKIRRGSRAALAALLLILLSGFAAPDERSAAFSIRTLSRDENQQTTITWDSSTNALFIVVSADHLDADAVWQPRVMMRGADSVTAWTDRTTSNILCRFYRVAQTDFADDFDADGMPSLWELTYGLDPLDPADAHTCLVCDGTDNLTKYRLGRDPTKPAVADASGLASLDVFTPME